MIPIDIKKEDVKFASKRTRQFMDTMNLLAFYWYIDRTRVRFLYLVAQNTGSRNGGTMMYGRLVSQFVILVLLAVRIVESGKF